MGALPTSASIRRLPQVLAATLVVVGLPVAAVSLLRASGAVTSPLLLVVSGMALSIAATYAGSAIWATWTGTGDTLFADLMLWGWLRRRYLERQLTSAARLLGLRSGSAGDEEMELSTTRRVRLLERLGGALEARSPATHGHSRRVARHAVAIAKRMGLPDERIARIRTAAAVHDVGKVETPLAILNKPGPLSDEEFAVIKRHPVVGAQMVAKLGDPELTRIVRHHHERLDGTGYPDGLSGDRIPVGARIVAVADTFDAVTSTRPYRSARTHKEAMALLADVAGTQLDPDAVRAFRGYYSGLRPAALWALLVNGPRQLFASLGGELRLGGLALAAKATAATAVTIAAGSVAAHALNANRGSSGTSDGQIVSRQGGFSTGDSAAQQSPDDQSNLDSSHKQGSGADGDNAAPGSNAASQGEARSGSQPGSPSGGDGSSSAGAPEPTPIRDGNTPSIVRDAPLPAPVSSVRDTVVHATDSLPTVPVTAPSLPDVHSVAPQLPGIGQR